MQDVACSVKLSPDLKTDFSSRSKVPILSNSADEAFIEGHLTFSGFLNTFKNHEARRESPGASKHTSLSLCSFICAV